MQSYHLGASLHHLMEKVNPTLEYTAPCAALGEQDLFLNPLPGRDDGVGVIV